MRVRAGPVGVEGAQQGCAAHPFVQQRRRAVVVGGFGRAEERGFRRQFRRLRGGALGLHSGLHRQVQRVEGEHAGVHGPGGVTVFRIVGRRKVGLRDDADDQVALLVEDRRAAHPRCNFLGTQLHRLRLEVEVRRTLDTAHNGALGPTRRVRVHRAVAVGAKGIAVRLRRRVDFRDLLRAKRRSAAGEFEQHHIVSVVAERFRDTGRARFFLAGTGLRKVDGDFRTDRQVRIEARGQPRDVGARHDLVHRDGHARADGGTGRVAAADLHREIARVLGDDVLFGHRLAPGCGG